MDLRKHKLTLIACPVMYLQANANMEVIISLSLSNRTTSPREASNLSSGFFSQTDGIITNTVNGVINTKGNNTPIRMYEQNVLMMTRVAGIKLLENMPDVPINAASQFMF